MTAAWAAPALVGIVRLPDAPLDGELGAYIIRMARQEAEPALAFSRMAGAVAACRRAAFALPPAERSAPPAGHDATMLPPTHPWSAAIGFALGSGSLRLSHEALVRVADAHASLPAALLPRALDLGRRNQVLRSALARAIGVRGRWLAQINPDWRYAAPDAPAADTGRPAWDEGSVEQRIAYFQALRAAEPAAARALLQSQAGELPAKERLAMVPLLADGLSIDDEALLAGLLRDRSREVRLAAAMLLAQVSGSEHAHRLVSWIEPLVTRQRGLLKAHWQCEAPAEVDAGWTAAAVEAKRPQYERLGERAWWLYQIVRQVPLAWWTAHTGLSPAELVRWASKMDWSEALLRGWRERVDAAHADWVDALLDAGGQAVGHERATLLRLLPIVRRERHWPRSLDALGNSGLLSDVVESCPLGDTLSPAFSQALVDDLRGLLAADRLRHDTPWRACVLELVCVVHADALRGWQTVPRRGDEPPALAECLDDLERRVAARRALHDL